MEFKKILLVTPKRKAIVMAMVVEIPREGETLTTYEPVDPENPESEMQDGKEYIVEEVKHFCTVGNTVVPYQHSMEVVVRPK